MTYQSSRIVLWYPRPFTLGDEPLACGVEHCASQVWIGYAEFRIGLHHLVHTEGWKQPALLWQGCIQKVLQLSMKRYFPLCCLGFQLSDLIGLDPDEPSQVPSADDVTGHGLQTVYRFERFLSGGWRHG